jgi:hypothetical protein
VIKSLQINIDFFELRDIIIFMKEDETPRDYQHPLSIWQVRAIQAEQRLGDLVAKIYPYVADMYKDTGAGYRFADLARVCLPVVSARKPHIAAEAVGVAIRKLIPDDEERAQLAKAHRKVYSARSTDYNSVEFRRSAREAARIRHELHDTPSEALTRGRGQTPWIDQERELVKEALGDPSLYHTRLGGYFGRPCYDILTDLINTNFHNGQPVRTIAAVRKYVSKHIKSNNER